MELSAGATPSSSAGGDLRDDAYEPPSVTDLGSFVDLTLGAAAGTTNDIRGASVG